MDTLQKLLGQDSPTGFTDKVVTVAEGIARQLGFATRRTNKGNLIITVPGRETGRKVGLCAHVDTLGLMVRSITADGMLMVTKVGGPLLPTLDGEYCRIYTRAGQVYTGTVLSLSPSVHVQDDAATRPRDEKNMAVRIDEKVHSKADVEALGIAAGDYVCYDPKTVVTQSGFVKSRFLDDKASAACLLTLLWQMHETGTKPRYETYFTLTVHEEVGHGGATLPAVDELLAVDMGCIGEDLSCTEYQVSICAKDGGGPTTTVWSAAWSSWPRTTAWPARWTSTPIMVPTWAPPGAPVWIAGLPSSARGYTPPTAWSAPIWTACTPRWHWQPSTWTWPETARLLQKTDNQAPAKRPGFPLPVRCTIMDAFVKERRSQVVFLVLALLFSAVLALVLKYLNTGSPYGVYFVNYITCTLLAFAAMEPKALYNGDIAPAGWALSRG